MVEKGDAMSILLEYIGESYMTIMLIAGLVVILFANRATKIDGVRYVWVITGLVFALTLFEYLESWCTDYHKPVWILYVKGAVCYIIHPLLIILELFLIAPIKHKKLLLLPYFADVLVIIADLFGTNLIYGYDTETYAFRPGELHFLPAAILCFYMIMLMKYSLDFVQQKEYSKAMIVVFLSFSALLTILLEYWNIITDHTTEIAALEMLIYYFYLAAIHHSKIQKKLHESELELEKQTNELLMAQIQPHFINNSLMAIQARCIDNPEVYESMKNFSRYLRSNFDNIGTPQLITFEQELKNIKAYLALEKMNFGGRMDVEYCIDSYDFMLPALTVEPLVENAVRHGVAARENGGVVQIIQRDEEDGITIDVRDIGHGKINLTERQEKRKGIGVANVRARLAIRNYGELELIPEENGTCARITLKNAVYSHDEGDDGR